MTTMIFWAWFGFVLALLISVAIVIVSIEAVKNRELSKASSVMWILFAVVVDGVILGMVLWGTIVR